MHARCRPLRARLPAGWGAYSSETECCSKEFPNGGCAKLADSCAVPLYAKMLCELSSNATVCKRGYDVFSSIAQCCSTTFRASGGCANVTATPTTCYTPDSFWPDRTCKATGKCDILYPRTNVFATGEECCAKSFADGCKVFPTTCKVPAHVKKTCVDGEAVECKRGGWAGCSKWWRQMVLLRGKCHVCGCCGYNCRRHARLRCDVCSNGHSQAVGDCLTIVHTCTCWRSRHAR